jgi:poly(ribitol-phosphate) beta-N-acetylglucosaminyltransferase
MVKVSVVVPIYNPGPYFEACMTSLLKQSLPASDYEIVLVDDGSTDGTHDLLDELAAAHPHHVRVVHQENSGWPGKPRNVGVKTAIGEYVQFVDQDDELAPEALERLYDLGVRNGSDIVLGKVAGTMAGPSDVFARTVDRATIEEHRLYESLTPHKMFRRDFLLDRDIWFPEGKVRLEDQLFMVKAYLRAGTISILGDYPCYYWMRRDDGGNTSSKYTAPATYFKYLENVMDAVVADTEPGPLRDRMLARFVRVEIMARVREPKVLLYSERYRQQSYEVVRRILLERFRSPDGVRALLSPMMRLRTYLLELGRLDSLMELARRGGEPIGEAVVEQATCRGSKLTLRLRTGLFHRDGTPVVIVRSGDRYVLGPRLVDGVEGVPEQGWDVGDPLDHAEAEVRVFDRAGQVWWFPPADLRPELVARGLSGSGEPTFQVMLAGTTTIDAGTLAGGRPLAAGAYDIWIGMQTLGLGRGPRPFGAAGVVRLLVDGTGQVRVRGEARTLIGRVLARPGVRRRGRRALSRLPAKLARRLRKAARRFS